MAMKLKLSASQVDKSTQSADCVFSKKNLTIDNVIIPVKNTTPIGLFKNGQVSEYIEFNHPHLPCWCGCTDKNWIRFEIVSLMFCYDPQDVTPKFSLMSIEKKDSYSDSDSDSECESNFSQEELVIENFPQTKVVNTYSEYEYDSHWDCYCKYRDVCGCGCDSDHDGW